MAATLRTTTICVRRSAGKTCGSPNTNHRRRPRHRSGNTRMAGRRHHQHDAARTNITSAFVYRRCTPLEPTRVEPTSQSQRVESVQSANSRNGQTVVASKIGIQQTTRSNSADRSLWRRTTGDQRRCSIVTTVCRRDRTRSLSHGNAVGCSNCARGQATASGGCGWRHQSS